MKKQNWIYQPEPSPDEMSNLATQLDIPLLIAKLLIQRDITSKADAEYFLNPKLDHLSDPFIFPDMENAVQRINEAILKQEHIMIHGDYDVDGVTSTALLYLTLKQLGAHVSFYIPNRISDGYGLSENSIEEAARRKTRLLITADCGITATNQVALADSIGIDTVVTDHHEYQGRLSNATAVINPKSLSADHPAYHLAGVGVAFKLVQALFQNKGFPISSLQQYLDLVAMGSIADLVPLVKENRVLAYYGMSRLAEGINPGFNALLEVTNLKGKPLTTGQLVFILAPRINAVGRLGDAQLAVRLFTTSNHQQALNIARIMEDKNRRRRQIDEETFREACELVEESVDLDNTSAIVLASNNWHQGVIGIVASRIVEKFNRPTVMISLDQEKGIGKGSARSIEGFHLFEALKSCEEYLLGFGGHKYAAGLTILPEQITELRSSLQQTAREQLTDREFVPRLKIDSDIELDEINDNLFRYVSRLAPFGPENMRPVFVARAVELVGPPNVVGNNHLKFKVRKHRRLFDAMAFNMADQYFDRLQFERPLMNIAFIIEENIWQGRRNLQLRVKGIKFNADIQTNHH